MEMDMMLRFQIVIKGSPVDGSHDVVIEPLIDHQVATTALSVQDVTRGILDTEHFIERLTGRRVHIQQVG
jgi:hypothetical protein